MGPDLVDPGDVGPAAVEEEKRIRVGHGDNYDDEEDEDWLRYSPVKRPGEGNGDAEMARAAEVEERVLSRYATEIDGDCVPITGLDGERVYAKICRIENEERVKKLDIKCDLSGEFYVYFLIFFSDI